MNYTISRRIGGEGFGTVFEAHDERGARYAAKVVDPRDPVARDLLVDQYKFLSGLSHPRVVRVIDLDLHAARGPDDDHRAGRRRRPQDLRGARRARVLLRPGDRGAGRAAPHPRPGQDHGDLKPDGILVAERGGRAEVTLVDAGFDFAKGTHLPTIGGTLPYLAPEIIRNQPADGRSDLYSLGVALYEVLTGSRPFEGATQEEILRGTWSIGPRRWSNAAPGVDRAWDRFIAKLLEKKNRSSGIRGRPRRPWTWRGFSAVRRPPSKVSVRPGAILDRLAGRRA